MRATGPINQEHRSCGRGIIPLDLGDQPRRCATLQQHGNRQFLQARIVADDHHRVGLGGSTLGHMADRLHVSVIEFILIADLGFRKGRRRRLPGSARARSGRHHRQIRAKAQVSQTQTHGRRLDRPVGREPPIKIVAGF